MVKNPCLKFVSGLLALGAFFSLLTCSDNVGLGSSVDTEAPKVEITYPPASSRIRSTFILAGNCSDDKAVTSVDVQVLDSTKETILKTWTATLAKDAKSWTAEIDSTQLEDGQYYFQTFSHDAANRKSASNDIYYDIDNTAPVLVLTKPTSYGTQEAKGYGQTVQLEGAFSEQGNVIEKLIVSFYDEAGNKLFDNTFSSISDISNANPLVIARYYKDEADETGENYRTKAENVQRWQNYQKLFGEDAIATYEQGKIVESKQFYFTVTAIDDTCVYTDPVDKTFEDEGNATSIFYRGTNEVLNLINNNNPNFPNFSVRSLRDYINGTDTEYEEDKTKEEELKAILAAAETKSIISEEAIDDTSNWLTFSMNPRNNPTFTVSGFVLDPEKDDKDMYTVGYRNYLTDNPMTLSLATGLDGTNLSTCTITLYYQDTLDADEDGERDNPKKVLWTWNEAVAQEYGVTLSRYTATEADANTDALTQQTELTLGDVVLGHKYVIFAEGNDINGQALIASNNRGFGFYASSNVAAPEFKQNPTDQKMNLADMSVINQATFEGTGFGLSGIVSSAIEVTGMSYSLTVTNGTNAALFVTTDTERDGETVRKVLTSYEPESAGSTNYTWSYQVEATDEMKTMISETPGYYIVLIEITATNGRESVFSRRFYLDNASPTIGNISVPLATAKELDTGRVYYINPQKKFAISGLSQDNYSPEITTRLAVTGDGTFAPAASTAKLWTFSDIDLSSFSGESAVAVITAEDEAGNISEETRLSLVFDVTGPVLSESPKDTIGGAEYNAENWFNTKSLSVAGTWNDSQSGTKNVYYEVVKENGSPSLTPNNYIDCKSTATDNGSFSMSVSGFENGTNTLRYLATDNVDNVSSLVERTVRIDTAPPTVTVSSTTTLSNATKAVEIPLEIADDASGVKTVVLKVGSAIVSETDNDKTNYTLTPDDTGKKYVKLTLTKDYLVTLAEGYHAVSLEVTDVAGNMTTQSIGTLNIDVTVPSITITPATNYYIKNSLDGVEAIVSDASGIQNGSTENQIAYALYKTTDLEDDGSPKTDAEALASEMVPLTEGKASISGIATSDASLGTDTKLVVRITATDKAGNVFSKNTAPYTIDKTAPSIGSSVTGAPTENVGGKNYDADNLPWFKDAALSVVAPWTEDGIGIKSVYYQVVKEGDTDTVVMNSSNYTEKGTPVSTTVVTKSQGKYEEFNTTIGGFTQAGTYKVYFIAVDKLDNVSAVTEWTIKIDSTAPNIVRLDDTDEDYSKSKPFDAIVLTNGKSATLYFCATDEVGGSGVNPDAVSVTVGSNTVNLQSTSSVTPVDLSVENGLSKYKFTLALAEADLDLSGYQPVTVTVTDKAGNSKSTSIGTLNIDSTAPKVSISLPAAGSSVNKKVAVSGKATDVNTVTNVTLTAEYNGITKTYTYPASDTAEGTITYDSGIWSVTVDTSDYTSESATNLVLTVKATDEAGNTSAAGDTAGNTSDEMTRTVTLDQNTDRPVIQLMNVKAQGDTLTQKTISGSVSDDDGLVTAGNFFVSENQTDWISAAATDSPLTYTNGSWVYTLKDLTQGERKLYFKVIDAEGTVFSSGADSNLLKPYVQGMEYTSGTTSDVDVYLSYTLDTLAPEIDADDCSVLWTASVASGSTPEDYKNGILFGKTKSATFSLTVYASDLSGIKTMSAKLGSADEVSISGGDIVSAPTDDKPNRYMGTISMTVPDTDANGESMSLVITVTDNNGADASVSRTVVVDNVAPTVTVNSPKSGSSVISSTEVRGITQDGESGSGTTEIRWYIPTNTEISNWTSGSTVTVPTSALSKFTVIKSKDDNGNLTDENSTLSWSISFTEGTNNAGKLSQYFTAIMDENGKITGYKKGDYGEDTSSSGVWKLPIYFYIKDSAENYRFDTSYAINVNPDGDKPTAQITYPSSDNYDKDLSDSTGATTLGYITLGGSIRVTGTAEDNESVSAVYLEIQKAKYQSDNSLPAMESTDALMDDDYVAITDSDGKTYSNVLAEGTTGWYYVIDGTTELFGAPQGYDQSRIRVRAWAVDNNNTKGAATGWVYITIDTSAPRIGSTTPLKLVQYADNDAGTGAVTASQSYTSGMYISGTWWLVASVEDDSGIESVKTESVVINSSDGGNVAYEFGTKEANDDIPSNMHGYNFRLKLTTTGTGTFKCNLRVTDTSNPSQYSLSNIYLQFDNTAPTQDVLYHGTKEIGDGTNGTVKVIEDNKTFLIKSTVIEKGSGLERMAMYLKRSGQSQTRLYDPRFANTDNANRIEIGDDSADRHATIDDTHAKLPYRTYTGVTRSTDDSFTLTSADSFITKASIVQIAGVYRLISKVEGSTYTFTPADTTRNTSVDAIYALVIDNTKAETITAGVPDGDGKDGDSFYDQVSDDGSSYSWKAAFTSGNIPDGPLEICYVAFDVAQNASELKKVTTFVANNTPRITRVYLGTDLSGADSDGNHAIAKDTETVMYSMLEQNTEGEYEAVEEGEINAIYRTDGKTFIAKDYSEIWVELVGGNGSLYADWKSYTPSNYSDLSNITWNESATAGVGVTINASSAETLAFSKLDTSTSSMTINGEEVTTKQAIIKHTVADDKLSGMEDGYVKTVYTIWDSTEETTPGTDSLSAKLSVMFEVDVVDNTAPVVTVDPFYWKSASENSLFGNSSANGHIELEADWKLSDGYAYYQKSEKTDYYQKAQYDGDPKVSGKISIRGTAFDNTRLTEIWAHIDDFAFEGRDTESAFGFAKDGTASATPTGTYYKIAEYTVDSEGSASWEGSGDSNLSNGWQFTAEGLADQSGHSITWQLDFDTAQITGAAGVDKNIRIIAVDGRQSSSANKVKNASSESSLAAGTDSGQSGYTELKNAPFYQVDVVPYITSVTTVLSALKKNNPSVYNRTAQGHYPVYYYGKDTDGMTAVAETVTISGFNFTAGHEDVTKVIGTDITATGAFEITVSEVKSLNNVNYKDAKGDYKKPVDLTTSPTGDKSIYQNYYNRQPNGDNNNLLTDDVYFDVWEFNDVGISQTSGYITEPIMKINPKNGMLNFGFNNGPANYSMANGQTTSFTTWVANYARFSTCGFTVDENGNTHGITVGLDTNPGDSHSAGRMQYFTSKWGVSALNTNGNYEGKNSCRFECIGVPSGTYNGQYYSDYAFIEDRFASPSLITAVHDDDTYVFLAYYDDVNGEIRFKWGNLSNAYYDTNTSNTSVTEKQAISFDQFVDYRKNTGWANNTHTAFDSNSYPNDYSTIASSSTSAGAGNYVAIDVIKGDTVSDDVIVATWYDATNAKWYYSYKKAPCNDNDMADSPSASPSSGEWRKPLLLESDAGENCQITVDKRGGIHIASYDGANANLLYAYLSSYDATDPQVVTVDAYAFTGTNIRLDTALSAVGNYVVPYIGYYSSSIQKPKMAYLSDCISASTGEAAIPQGVDATSETFTAKWESTILPTKTRFADNYGYSYVNIGVWKDSEGKITTSSTGTNSYTNQSGLGKTNTGMVYGNGKATPILGYATRVGTRGHLETAQMK